MEDKIAATVKTTIRRAEGGFRMTRTVETSNGNQLETSLNGAEITWLLDSKGAVKSISGYDKPLAAFFAALPAESRAQAEKSITVDALAARERSDWEAGAARLMGRTLQIGQPVIEQRQTPGPGGAPMTLAVTTTLTRMEPCPAGKCARITTVMKSAAEAPVNIQSDAQMLIDPATGLVYSETLTRTARVQQGGQAATIKENRQSAYAYERP